MNMRYYRNSYYSSLKLFGMSAGITSYDIAQDGYTANSQEQLLAV